MYDQVAHDRCSYEAGEGKHVGDVVYLLMARLVELERGF
jgi:hypothetical protein